jgi:glycosyltransferase involved in cell wall biosynthesis
MLRDLKKARKFFNSEGVRGLYRGLMRKVATDRRNRIYQDWITKYDVLTDQDLTQIASKIKDLNLKPLISILMPVYNVDEKWLRIAIGSVVDQSYPYWELCIADDNSPASHIKKVLNEYVDRDNRIKVVYRGQNGHISAASNSALELATGDFACLLDHDDELSPNALYFVAKQINEFPDTDMIYSDEDKIDTRGRRSSPSFKPDWSPDLFYSLNLITHLSVYRTSVLREVGGFRIGFEGSQDYDLGLRVSERIEPSHIRHIPRILYHWRSIPGSVALDSSEKDYAHDRARVSIAEHFSRLGIDAQVVRGYRELHRTIYGLPESLPLVSLIVFGDHKDPVEIDRILDGTGYPNIELIFAERRESSNDSLDSRLEIINFAALNTAANNVSGQLLCFLDSSTTVRTPKWLRELVGIAVQKNIGVVGPRIIYPNGRIKSAGLIIGINGGIGRAHHRAPRYGLGNFFRLQVTQNVSALPVDCVIMRKDVFDSQGGFDTESFPNEYGDVDLSLRLLAENYRNVWTPGSELTQRNERTFNKGPELDSLKTRWPEYFGVDPYYNPNLTMESEDLSLAFPPRLSRI